MNKSRNYYMNYALSGDNRLKATEVLTAEKRKFLTSLQSINMECFKIQIAFVYFF